MGTYVLLTRLTDDGAKTMKERPERLKEVNKEVEAMGVKIIGQYALLGQFDFLNIIEAPDNETITQVAVELASRGTVRTMTLPAIEIGQVIKKLKK